MSSKERLAFEVNFDGLPGPTHNYAGLSLGNIASMSNQSLPAHPRQAALQALEKMLHLMELGLVQAVLPPQERPSVRHLRRLGYGGSDEEVIETAYQNRPDLLALCCSASSMWAANAATCCPSADSMDGRVHITPANLVHNFHRQIERKTTLTVFRRIFHNERYFCVHEPLPSSSCFGDEGAANHNRFCKSYGGTGIQLFVFGRSSASTPEQLPKHFPARQTLEASEAICRLNAVLPELVLFAQQHPQAVDAGVFHNDVVSVSNQNVFLYHEHAFLDQEQVIDSLSQLVQRFCQTELICIPISAQEVPLSDAVGSYLFNSQIVTTPSEGMILVAPLECQSTDSVRQKIESFIDDPKNPLSAVHYLDVRESMKNGGGPGCLRQRIVLTEEELSAIHQGVILTPELYVKLREWICQYYREELTIDDLRDPQLLQESRAALDSLTQILDLGSLYSFQEGTLP